MHTLELVTDEGKTLTFTIDEENGSDVQGGMMSGDRMAVTYYKTADENIAHKVINLTTLLGRWTSLDKNFTINEDGSIDSNVPAESKPYTAWAICNAKLILNTDTFEVLTLGADTLEQGSDYILQIKGDVSLTINHKSIKIPPTTANKVTTPLPLWEGQGGGSFYATLQSSYLRMRICLANSQTYPFFTDCGDKGQTLYG